MRASFPDRASTRREARLFTRAVSFRRAALSMSDQPVFMSIRSGARCLTYSRMFWSRSGSPGRSTSAPSCAPRGSECPTRGPRAVLRGDRQVAACWKSTASRARTRWPRVTSPCCLGRILTFFAPARRCPPFSFGRFVKEHPMDERGFVQLRRRPGPDLDARRRLLPVPGAGSDAVAVGAAGRRPSPERTIATGRELARADAALHRGGDGLRPARLTLGAQPAGRHPVHPGGARLPEHGRADPCGMAEGPERRTGRARRWR